MQGGQLLPDLRVPPGRFGARRRRLWRPLCFFPHKVARQQGPRVALLPEAQGQRVHRFRSFAPQVPGADAQTLGGLLLGEILDVPIRQQAIDAPAARSLRDVRRGFQILDRSNKSRLGRLGRSQQIAAHHRSQQLRRPIGGIVQMRQCL